MSHSDGPGRGAHDAASSAPRQTHSECPTEEQSPEHTTRREPDVTPDEEPASWADSLVPELSTEIKGELRAHALRRIFHSPAYNQTDGLDSDAEDFTTFELLSGPEKATVTGLDHQRQIAHAETQPAAGAGNARNRQNVSPTVGVATSPVVSNPDERRRDRDDALLLERAKHLGSGKDPRALALHAMQGLDVEPTSLIPFHSDGRILILGEDAEALEVAARLEAPLTPHVLLPSSVEDETVVDGVALANATLLELKGYLGEFRAWVTRGGEAIAAGELFGASDSPFDLVLDLRREPAFALEMPPLGYRAARPGTDALENALDELRRYTGELEKPKYFAFVADRCAHSARGIEACRRCLEICPADAIRSIEGKIQVDPHLCQGGGSCATSCPSGAIRYVYPDLEDTLRRLAVLLTAYQYAGGSTPILVIHDAAQGAERVETLLSDCGNHLLPFEVEELAAVGLEVWLAALAFGAHEVVVLVHPGVTPSMRRTIEEQMGYGRGVLAGMGYDLNRLRILSPKEARVELRRTPELERAATELPGRTPDGLRARLEITNDKRAALHAAIAALNEEAPSRQELVPLAKRAPFGEVLVDAQRCTLCMACVSVCPARALHDGGDSPSLRFVEADCLQCGLCTAACPEGAMSLSARYLFAASARDEPRVLHEEPPFACVSCGKAFATQSVIRAITSRLRGHRMFRDEAQLKRLQMCEDCRVADLFQADSR